MILFYIFIQTFTSCSSTTFTIYRLILFSKINCTTKILKQPLTMMKKVTVNSCTVNSSNVYNNTSGIDFYKFILTIIFHP